MAKKTLITSDIIKLVQSSNANVVPFDVNRYVNIKIGRVLISKGVGADPILNLDASVDKDYMELWNNDVGRLLVRELKKESPNIYELNDEKYKALLILVDESDYDLRKEKGFLHVEFGDNRYTIVKIVKPGESYKENDNRNDYFSSFSVDDVVEQSVDDEPNEIDIVETELF